MFSRLDWQAPWYVPWREPGEAVARRVAAGLPLHEALTEQGGAPVRFVTAAELPAGKSYERHVFENRTCPTRANLHDFFNGLVWLRLPKSKNRLNVLHAGQLAQASGGSARGPVRDAITLFDENGALLDAPAALWEALRAREWRRLFVELRPLWAQARVMVFGHALLEKLTVPRKEMTAHVWATPCTGGMAELDDSLCSRLSAERLAAKPFTPLPLLGIPGWCPENQNFSFYDDSLVFRPRGPKNVKTTAPPATSRP